uniref:Auxin response factor n=1 Tax=Eucommia ulmoides TaxID=4392 RepID=A0A649UIP9_EUCUL|nr:ARF10.2 [Eucommia ulmoides]
MNEAEKVLDFNLWQACAGSMARIPPVNSKVFYFPQGHAEHTLIDVDYGVLPKVPPVILCRVSSVKFLAHLQSDEVYAKMKLVPIRDEDDGDDDLEAWETNDSSPRFSSLAKILTQSDSNNGGGFSVPRYCAETLFPPLDYASDTPLQTLAMKDIQGKTWNFKHIFRGSPKRHLFTTGWSVFVNKKQLIGGDSVVFMKGENGDLSVGIRRYQRGGFGGPPSLSRWKSTAGKEGDKSSSGDSADSFMEAVSLAAKGKPFEVVYYPRSGTPEFCVKASSVSDAMRIAWHPGMRFRMAFETEDSSRISWSIGTIAAVQATDPAHWPDSPWQCLQVTWDEPDQLQNVKRVSPWLLDLVSNMPIIQIPQFSPPRKKLKLSHHPQFPLDDQFQMPFVQVNNNSFGPNGPLTCCLYDNIPLGIQIPSSIQGARHPLFELPFSGLHLTNDLQFRGFQPIFQRLDLDLRLDNSSKELEKMADIKKPSFKLFGQQIYIEPEIQTGQENSQGCSSDALSDVVQTDKSDGNPVETEKIEVNQRSIFSSGNVWNLNFPPDEHGDDTGHCQAFLDSDNVGKTLDLSATRSYEELHQRLAAMFGLERSEMLSRVLYQDAMGIMSETGNEPYSEFMKTAKRLTLILASSS